MKLTIGALRRIIKEEVNKVQRSSRGHIYESGLPSDRAMRDPHQWDPETGLPDEDVDWSMEDEDEFEEESELDQITSRLNQIGWMEDPRYAYLLTPEKRSEIENEKKELLTRKMKLSRR